MASEKRLIDANALLAKAANPFYQKCGSKRISASATVWVAGLVNQAPTVDAVEVVHGRWEDEHGGKYANPRYRCSVCKKRALYKFERDLLDNWKEVQALTPNCPYCMAKLDGERKDNEKY